MDIFSEGVKEDKEKGIFFIEKNFESKNPMQLIGSAYWVHKDFFKQILSAILKQLSRVGLKIVVAHGHGPSISVFENFLEEWCKEFRLQLYTCWEKEGSMDELGIQTDHAAANETSLMMAIRPDLVNIDNLLITKSEEPLGLIGKDPRKFTNFET